MFMHAHTSMYVYSLENTLFFLLYSLYVTSGIRSVKKLTKKSPNYSIAPVWHLQPYSFFYRIMYVYWQAILEFSSA